MREILFRGKRIDNGEWVESGSPARIGNDGVHWDIYLGSGKAAEHDLDEHGNILASVTLAECLFYKVDPTTVGQYTGLTDKNGKRIFEGDIIRTERNGGRTYFVLFDDDLCAFIGRVYERNIFTTFEGDGDRYEVIGNVHDNPELLKEEPT